MHTLQHVHPSLSPAVFNAPFRFLKVDTARQRREMVQDRSAAMQLLHLAGASVNHLADWYTLASLASVLCMRLLPERFSFMKRLETTCRHRSDSQHLFNWDDSHHCIVWTSLVACLPRPGWSSYCFRASGSIFCYSNWERALCTSAFRYPICTAHVTLGDPEEGLLPASSPCSSLFPSSVKGEKTYTKAQERVPDYCRML